LRSSGKEHGNIPGQEAGMLSAVALNSSYTAYA
jgi:hypothetical protein